jgi:hypothetical protein
MFLKRVSHNKNILLKKFNIDIWGYQLLKKKLNSNTTQKFLQYFMRFVLNPGVAQKYKPPGKFKPPKVTKKQLRKSGGKQKSSKQSDKLVEKQVSHHVKTYTRLKDSSAPFKRFIFNNMINYFTYYRNQVLEPQNALLQAWGKEFRNYANKVPRSRVRLKRFYRFRKSQYTITRRVDAIFQQYYYGFSTLNSFKCYIKRHAGKHFSWKTETLGVEGMFANQIYRLGMFPTMRYGYLLIKTGVVRLNGQIIRNPRRILKVGDEFMFTSPTTAMVVFNYLLYRLEVDNTV